MYLKKRENGAKPFFKINLKNHNRVKRLWFFVGCCCKFNATVW